MRVYGTIALLILVSTISLAQQRVTPYLQSVTSDAAYICWEATADPATTVQYGTTQALGSVANGSYEDLSGSYRWHSTKLTGLTPNTLYYYRVATGQSLSRILTFHTRDLAGSRSGNLRFIVRGDNQDNPQAATKVVNAMKSKMNELYGPNLSSNVDMIFTVGDLVGDGWNLSHWRDQYFAPASAISGSVPFMACLGNHENESIYFYQLMQYDDFGGDEGESYYAYQVNTALFLSLNSNWQYQNDTQIDWLETVLAAAEADRSIDWVFAFCHHPGRSEGWPEGNTSYVQDRIIPTLQQFDKAEFLIYGHVHNYERGATREGDLRLMCTSGGGGELARWRWYEQEDYEEIQKSFDHYNYVLFDIDLANQSYTGTVFSLGHEDRPLDNEIIDTFYRKRLGTTPPDTPTAQATSDSVDLPHALQASTYSGVEPVLSSQFRLTTPGDDYSSTIVDEKRDFENIYYDSGSPDWEPIDLNAGIDLESYDLTMETLPIPGEYIWSVRYRDQNVQWSDWSQDQSLIVRSTGFEPTLNYNKSFLFDGTDSYVLIADDLNDAVLPQRAMTIEGWVYLNSFGDWEGFIGAVEDNAGYEKGWVLGTVSSNFSIALSTDGPDDGDGFITYLEASDPFQTGQWYHLAASYNGTVTRLFVNGQLQASGTTQSGDINYDTDSEFVIGGYKDDNEFYPLHGELDEMRLWDTALNQTIIQDWMHQEINSNHPRYSALISEWTANDVTINALIDNAGNNTGTYQNMTAFDQQASTVPVGLHSAFADVQSTVTAGDAGTDIAVTISSTPDSENYLGIYQSGENDGTSIAHEIFPPGVTVRNSVFWGIREYGSVTCSVLLNYREILGLPAPNELILLYRSDAISDWIDISSRATHDDVAGNFLIATFNKGGEFSLGWNNSTQMQQPTTAELNISEFALKPNYPNPFNPSTTIEYQLPATSEVKLEVFDIAGRLVIALVSGEEQPSGRYKTIWEGQNMHGEQVSSGIYLYRLTAGSFVQSRKMLLTR